MTSARSRPATPDAVLFDLDGVLTDTAAVHERAWAALFTDYLSARHPPVPPYQDSDYFDHIDGKTRADGVRTMLASRGISLPEGEPDDPPGDGTVNALGNRKNAEVGAILGRDGVVAFPGSVALVEQLSDRGIPMAVVSSSRNAPVVLRTAGLTDRFRLVVDGSVAEQVGLAGKPAPDMFTHAAAALGADPARSIVVEDALAGVAAGRAGGFWVVGVDRGVGAAALRDAGADETVDDLAALLH